jgi:uncharacterized membrane protein YdjX (TVP38/TMEM64 family)
MKSLSHRVIAMIAFILLIGVLGILAQRYGSMERLVQNEIRLRESVQQNRAAAWMVGLVVYTAFSLVPGTSGKSVVFGWLFGFWQAVLMVDLALTIAAVVSFMAARYLIRDYLTARFNVRIQKLNRGLERDGVFYLLLMRLAHMPYTFVNYGSGTTSVPLRTFAWTTMVGILPGTMVFVFVGTRIPTLSAIADKGILQLLDPLLFAVLAAAVVLPATIHWAIRRFELRGEARSAAQSTDSHSVERRTNGVH